MTAFNAVKWAAAVALASVVCSASGAEVAEGARVVGVSDGDTVTVVLPGNERRTVRLSSIDAPERAHTNARPGAVGQPYAQAARDGLSILVKGQSLRMECSGRDRYERWVCEVRREDGVSVNREMVRLGWAWAYEGSGGRYMKDKALPALQREARDAGRGLWREAGAVEPWRWRVVCWDQGNCR